MVELTHNFNNAFLKEKNSQQIDYPLYILIKKKWASPDTDNQEGEWENNYRPIDKEEIERIIKDSLYDSVQIHLKMDHFIKYTIL